MPTPTRLSWRVLSLAEHPGPWNMALDHALALTLPSSSGVVRFYGWSRPTLSLGRHEPATGVWNPEAARKTGVDVVRRPTGGRAVFHQAEVTYSVAVPARVLGGARGAYALIHRGLVLGLRKLGVPAALVTTQGRVLSPDAGPCFRDPTPGEIMVAGRKVVGSAQARLGAALLQHGSVLLDGSQEESLARLRCVGGRAASSPEEGGGSPGATTLTESLGYSPTPDNVAGALLQGLGEVLPGFQEAEGEMGSVAEVGALAQDLLRRYESSEWTWLRKSPEVAAVSWG
ncbi:MAG: biotin/lipoate A/B protein ligase family protein [Gemmatimonadota bacterium]